MTRTLFGRTRPVPEITSTQFNLRNFAERTALNTPLQGTAADLIKLAMVAVQNFLDEAELKTLLIMQVHDELVLEVPESELQLVKEKLRELMQNVARLDVELVVDVGVGNNWDEAH